MDYDEEIIGVKPPIDIIPDEYECFKEDLSEKIIVNTFCSSSLAAQNNVRTFVNSLAEGYYDVSEHSLEKDNCPKILETIRKKCDSTKNAAGLILFFCGKCNDNGELYMYDGKKYNRIKFHELWRYFYSDDCYNLKNKPKLFLFEVKVTKEVETDFKGGQELYELTYDTPNEADIFILIHKTQDDQDKYMSKFCDNIKNYGKFENITALATCVDKSANVPMIISTLTRKFYFAHNDRRGYDHIITEMHTKIMEKFTIRKEIKEKVPTKRGSQQLPKRNNLEKPGTNCAKSRVAQSSSKITTPQKSTASKAEPKHTSTTVTKLEESSKSTEATRELDVSTDKLDTSISSAKPDEDTVFKKPYLPVSSSTQRRNSTSVSRSRTKSTSDIKSSEKPPWKV